MLNNIFISSKTMTEKENFFDSEKKKNFPLYGWENK